MKYIGNYQKREGRQGFTIVELLIVIIVIAILAAIVIVSYNGIQDRARQSANLEALDQFEKGLRMYESEAGTPPSMYTNPDEVVVSGDLTANLTQAIADYKNGISRSQPLTSDVRMPACLPGNYPATGVFGEGECLVTTSTTVLDSPYLELHQRMAFIASQNVANSIAPKYLASLPVLDIQGFEFGYSANSQTVQLDGTTSGPGSVSMTQAIRGAMYSSYSGSPAVITYFVRGDQTCGRGKKELMSMSDMKVLYEEQLQDAGADPATISVNLPNNDQWTSCAISIE
jgi:prepilin-type N-terminal cleavage/methylation domain-containing protein